MRSTDLLLFSPHFQSHPLCLMESNRKSNVLLSPYPQKSPLGPASTPLPNHAASPANVSTMAHRREGRGLSE